MVRRITELSSDFTNVGASKKAELSAPTIGTYFQVILEVKYAGALATVSQMIAATTGIVLVEAKLNGKVQFALTGAEIFAILQEKGETATDGYLPLDFAEIHRLTGMGEDATAWGMQDIHDFDIHVTFGTQLTPTIRAFRDWQPGVHGSGSIVSQRKFTKSITGAGTLDFEVPFIKYRGKNGMTYKAIPAIRLFGSNITEVTDLSQGGRDLLGELPPALLGYKYGRRGYAKQAGLVTLSPELNSSRFGDAYEAGEVDGVLADVLDVSLAMSGTETITVIVDDLGPRA